MYGCGSACNAGASGIGVAAPALMFQVGPVIAHAAHFTNRAGSAAQMLLKSIPAFSDISP